MSEYIHICEGCREEVQAEQPGIIKAVERVRARTFGGDEWLDGMGVFFHEHCYPHGSRYYRIVTK